MNAEQNCDTENYTLDLDELTNKQLSIYLYKNIQNIDALYKKIISKSLPCCIVKANLVLDPFQIAIAANKAALNEKYNQMVTRSLYTEIIYYLSISKNISQSLATFGISNDSVNALVIFLQNIEQKELNEKLTFECIIGERVPISNLFEFSDINLIENTYKIGKDELKASTLLNSIVTRISEKI